MYCLCYTCLMFVYSLLLHTLCSCLILCQSMSFCIVPVLFCSTMGLENAISFHCVYQVYCWNNNKATLNLEALLMKIHPHTRSSMYKYFYTFYLELTTLHCILAKEMIFVLICHKLHFAICLQIFSLCVPVCLECVESVRELLGHKRHAFIVDFHFLLLGLDCNHVKWE